MLPQILLCLEAINLSAFVFTCSDGRPVSCCLKIGRSKPPLDKVLNYKIQTKGLCPITAVHLYIFRIQTVHGKRLCSDPNSDWTKRAIWNMDEAKKKLSQQDPLPPTF
uniref:Chemokine interleukin-8-like domain-containing protein n=1 Tax=Sinocyclocheilus grahami TaxID=75366 RepID=A0A672KFG0_SINGR